MEVESVDESDVDESRLVAYSDLSKEAKDIFKQALNEGRYISTESLPGKLDEVRYVKYEGDYYVALPAVGDMRVWEMSIEKVSS